MFSQNDFRSLQFKTLTMNDQEPEFASNLKRGLATYLQLNTSSGFNSVQIYKQPEVSKIFSVVIYNYANCELPL